MIGKDPRPSEIHRRACKELARLLIPALRYVAESYGYALATHGSQRRDIDLVAIPWREACPMSATSLMQGLFDVAKAIRGCADWPPDGCAGSLNNPEKKPHGRLAYTIHLGGGPYLDISVMPLVEQPKKEGST